MNARNLRYIRTKNSDDSISLADSKLKTKHFLSSRGIPFAETYCTIHNQQELNTFSLKNIQSQSFVVKPNRGSGGKGILIVKRDNDGYSVAGEYWTEEEINLHMVDILRGSFSLHGSPDSIVIEELLSPGKDFAQYCKYGLADIRIIVYNLVPITAMIRMPTLHSSGKANLAQGGIGIGLNIANGEVISLFQSKKIYTTSFPSEYEGYKNQYLPFWEEILLYSSQIQLHTKLGYLALDWVITKNGPKLLEINARAGLEIQNVNLVPLAARLKQIENLKVLSPEKGVEIAKTLFHTDILTDTLSKKILYLKQRAFIGEQEILLCCDIQRETTCVSHDLAPLIPSGNPIITDTHVSVSLREYTTSDGEHNTIILGKDILKEYLISPTLRPLHVQSVSDSRWTKDLLEYDEKVYKASKRVNLSSLLKPVNYFVALDAYIASGGEYDPVFLYTFPSETKILTLKDDLKRLFEYGHIMKQKGLLIAELYIEKLAEIENKILLIEAYKTENFDNVARYNDVLFGKTDQNLLSLAKQKVLEMQNTVGSARDTLGDILTLDQVMIAIHRYFEQHALPKIPITIERGNFSRMSVSYGKHVKIHISKNAIIRNKEIEAILSHEIGTHFRRYLTGNETGLKLFQFGTGYYLSDEEGFAICQSLEHLPEGYEKNAMYLKYYLLAVADQLSFRETMHLLRSLSPEKTTESLFADVVRLKRGTIHTGEQRVQGTTYKKDKIYLDGYVRVKQWLDDGGDKQKLFYGKIKIQDIRITDLL